MPVFVAYLLLICPCLQAKTTHVHYVVHEETLSTVACGGSSAYIEKAIKNLSQAVARRTADQELLDPDWRGYEPNAASGHPALATQTCTIERGCAVIHCRRSAYKQCDFGVLGLLAGPC
jgi:hypothetical protein